MIPIDLSGKVALVTGVADWDSFAFHISKALQAAGARLLLGCHPRVVGIVESILERDLDAPKRVLPYGAGSLKVEKVLACDVGFDTMADVDEKTRNDKRYAKHGDFTIQGMMDKLKPDYPAIDILVHSVAFSPEIMKTQVETSRSAYATALSVSAYSLTALCRAARPLMENRPDGASVVGLTYLGGERVVPHYGGGMSAAKAALQIDARQLAHNLGSKGIRVNLISAGPYASRAASSIGDIEAMKKYAADRSPLPRPIAAEEVGNATVFLSSPLASAITAQILYVDCGYHAMGV
ncbi:enoyl-ACP reductase [Planctomycetaceae bacterium SCGC AG-212-F19]|nr:enoyl-ACP reductase [Planctomycetaceae bacterium SCGC AG-212-F19]